MCFNMLLKRRQGRAIKILRAISFRIAGAASLKSRLPVTVETVGTATAQ